MGGAKFFDILENAFNTINHVFIGFITIYMTYICSQTNQNNRTWHVLLCTIGYQLLMAEGILALAPGNVWTYLVTRKTKYVLHWVMQFVGSVLNVVGIYLEYKNRTRHLNNLHETIGFASMIFMLIAVVNGLSNLYAKEMSKLVKPVYQRFFHNIISLTAFVLGMVSIYYGYNFRWVTNLVPTQMKITLQYLTIVTLVLTSIAAIRSCFLQVKQIFSKE